MVREAFDASVAKRTAVGPAREVPADEGVDRAQPGRHGVVEGAVIEQPAHLGRREVGSSREPRAGADRRGATVGHERGTGVGGAAVLPHDRRREHAAVGAVDRHGRLALVRDADHADVVTGRVRAGTRAPRASRRRAARISLASCSTQPGSGKDWVSGALRDVDDATVEVCRERPHARWSRRRPRRGATCREAIDGVTARPRPSAAAPRASRAARWRSDPADPTRTTTDAHHDLTPITT